MPHDLIITAPSPVVDGEMNITVEDGVAVVVMDDPSNESGILLSDLILDKMAPDSGYVAASPNIPRNTRVVLHSGELIPVGKYVQDAEFGDWKTKRCVRFVGREAYKGIVEDISLWEHVLFTIEDENTRLRPTPGNLLIKRDPIKSQTDSGLYLPDSFKLRSGAAEVVEGNEQWIGKRVIYLGSATKDIDCPIEIRKTYNADAGQLCWLDERGILAVYSE